MVQLFKKNPLTKFAIFNSKISNQPQSDSFSIDKDKYLELFEHFRDKLSDVGHLFSGSNLILKVLIIELKLLFALSKGEDPKKLLKKIHTLFRKLGSLIKQDKRKKREIENEWREKAENLFEEFLKKNQLEFEEAMKLSFRRRRASAQFSMKNSFCVDEIIKENTSVEYIFSHVFALFKRTSVKLRPFLQPALKLSVKEKFKNLC